MDNPIQFNPVTKDKLFYDKFQYGVSFVLNEVSALKTLDHNYIDAVIERRKVWQQTTLQRWASGQSRIAPLIRSKRHRREITEQTSEHLHLFAELLLTSLTEFKLVTSVDRAWIYSNDLEFIKEIGSLSYIENVQYSKAEVTIPRDTIKLKKPKHTHRSYFKSVKLSSKEKQNILGFLKNQSESIRLSPALIAWLATPYNRTQDYFFIDHLGESWLLMLSLVKTGLVRKTSSIIPA